MRARFAIALLCLCSCAAFAQSNETTQDAKVLFGWVKRPDGTKVDITGASIPIKIRKIAESWQIGKRPAFAVQKGLNTEAFTCYQNDNGPDSYFYIEGSPTDLDDLNLPSGAGVPWQWMKTGANVQSTQRVIARWRIFDTALSNTPPGQMAFTDEIADFGTYITPPQTGVLSFDVNVSIVGIVVPDGQCYLAQQFRDDRYTNGEGPFIFTWSNLFSGGGVSIGSSEDSFVFDNDPEPNGIYEWQEYDYFGGPPYEANFYARLIANGTSQELLPSGYTIVRGTLLGGGLTDLWYDDQSFLSLQGTFSPILAGAPVNIEVQSVAPTTNVLSMVFNAQVLNNKAGLTGRLDLYNFQTGQWVTWDTWQSNGVEQNRSFIVTSHPEYYVQQGTKIVKARLRVDRGAAFLGTTFRCDIDKMTWTIVR